MQLYAFDTKKNLIKASRALKQTDYFCLECNQVIRLRGGLYRQPHFFHLEPTLFCRQHQKGEIHLQLQRFFLEQLPEGDCQMECRFPSIQRIADVVWWSEKIVFEIQCSPISAQELLERNRDYARLNFSVVWILHDSRFNQYTLSNAEFVLREFPHFFSNMNEKGEGIIYDQFDVWKEGKRCYRLPSLPIQISFLRRKQPYKLLWDSPFLKERLKNWPIGFRGDLIDKASKNSQDGYLEEMLKLEEKNKPRPKTHFLTLTKKMRLVYQMLFKNLLEKFCDF